MYKPVIDQPANIKAPIPAGWKVCAGMCGQAYPLLDEHWHVDKSKPDGFRAMCRKCRSRKVQQRHGKRFERHVRRLDMVTMKMLTEAAKPGSRVPHVAEMYEGFIEALGGIGGFTQHCVGNYLMMPVGSPGRAAFLRDVMRLGIITTESGQADIPLDQLTDEDLERIQNERLKRITLHVPAENIRHASASKVS